LKFIQIYFVFLFFFYFLSYPLDLSSLSYIHLSLVCKMVKKSVSKLTRHNLAQRGEREERIDKRKIYPFYSGLVQNRQKILNFSRPVLGFSTHKKWLYLKGKKSEIRLNDCAPYFFFYIRTQFIRTSGWDFGKN